MTDSLICEVCAQPKYRLQKIKSKVMNKEILSCATCIKDGFEPRPLLIIAYLTNERMRKKAEPLIQNRKYVGKPILLEEIM